MSNPPRDLVFRPPPPLTWTEEQREASSDNLVAYASGEAQEAIAWYLKKKKGKRIGARSLRLLAIAAAAAAAVIPIIAQIYPQLVAPAWASAMLALAAAAIGLDRFFGFSSAWMRFLATELEIRRRLRQFHMRIEALRVESWGVPATAEYALEVVQICGEFLLDIDELLRNETSTWATELSSVLKEMEEKARAHADAEHRGSVKLTVSNGDQADAGWEASVDDDPAELHTGRTVTIRDIASGKHTIRVRAKISGQQKSSRKTVIVRGGETANLNFAL